MRSLSVRQLKDRLDAGSEAPLILDVREPWEINVCRIEPATYIPMREIASRHGEFDNGRDIAVLCHHGVRSRFVASFLEKQGFDRVYNVDGGIDAWAREIDPAMPTY